MINVSELINDPDFASNFQIERKSQGSFEQGEYSENSTIINANGIIQPYNPKKQEYDLQGNVVSADITICTLDEIFITQDNAETRTSDVIIYKNEPYKVKSVKNWSDNGYYRAIAERISLC